MFTILHNNLLAKSCFLLDSLLLLGSIWICGNGASSAFSPPLFPVYILPQIKPETARLDRVNCIIPTLSFPSIQNAEKFSFPSVIVYTEYIVTIF